MSAAPINAHASAERFRLPDEKPCDCAECVEIRAVEPRYYSCPDWCRLDDDRHDINLQNGRAVVDHDGPSFGPHISAGGMTYAETGQVAEIDATVSELDNQRMDPTALRALAAGALAAAAWLDDVQGTVAVAART